MNAALTNARRLLRDADALVAASSYPSAAALAILSIEEIGKLHILRMLLTVPQGARKSMWREYRSHVAKNVLWLFPLLVARGARRLDHFRLLFSESSPHAEQLDVFKQLCLYTDCLGDGTWSVPSEAADRDTAHGLVGIAKALCPDTSVSVRELELWIHHMAPTESADLAAKKRALVAWHKACQDEGLAAASLDMQAFVEAPVPTRAAQQ